jgi:hypothetical protein
LNTSNQVTVVTRVGIFLAFVSFIAPWIWNICKEGQTENNNNLLDPEESNTLPPESTNNKTIEENVSEGQELEKFDEILDSNIKKSDERDRQKPPN